MLTYSREGDAAAVHAMCAGAACWLRGGPRLAKPTSTPWAAIAGDTLCPFAYPRRGGSGPLSVHYGPCGTHKLFVCVSGGPEPLLAGPPDVGKGGSGDGSSSASLTPALVALAALLSAAALAALAACVRAGHACDSAEDATCSFDGSPAHLALRSDSSSAMLRMPDHLSPQQKLAAAAAVGHGKSPLSAVARSLMPALGTRTRAGGTAGESPTRELSMTQYLISAQQSAGGASDSGLSSGQSSGGGAPWIAAGAGQQGLLPIRRVAPT